MFSHCTFISLKLMLVNIKIDVNKHRSFQRQDIQYQRKDRSFYSQNIMYIKIILFICKKSNINVH